MKTYRTLDGALFTAESYAELAAHLWRSQFDPPPNLQDWMTGSAERARLWNGAQVRTDTPEHHIEDLLAAALLEEVIL
jgi:hypothetical protein